MKQPEINIDKAFDALKIEMEEWFVAIVTNLPNVVIAFFIIILFIFLSKYTRKISTKVTDRFTNSKSVSTLITNIISFSIFTTGLIIALGVMQLDGTVKSLLAGAGIIGLALGFAFQDIIVNLFSGIVIAINEPVHDGDLIESNGAFGYVKAIKLRAVFINNLEGQTVIIPCRDIIQKPLRNYSSEGMRRVDVPVGISYGEDLEFVKNITTEAIKDIEYLDERTGIEFYYNGFNNSSIDFVIRFWLSRVDEKIFLKAKSDAIMKIKAAYNQNDITIPFPIRTLDFGIKGGEKLSAMLKNYKSDNNE
jgi:small conductance mechanosensitive channel